MENDDAMTAIPLDGKLDGRRNVRKEPKPYDELPPEIQRVLESRMTKGSRKRTTVEVLEGKHVLSLIIYINKMSPVIKSDILNNVTKCSNLDSKLAEIEKMGLVKTYRLARSNTIVYVATPKGKEVTGMITDLIDFIEAEYTYKDAVGGGGAVLTAHERAALLLKTLSIFCDAFRFAIRVTVLPH